MNRTAYPLMPLSDILHYPIVKKSTKYNSAYVGQFTVR